MKYTSKTEKIMIQHEAKNVHGDSAVEFLPMEMLALTPLSSNESYPDVFDSAGDSAFPMPLFALADSDDDEDDMEEDDFDDMEEEDFDDDEDDFDEDDDDDEDEDEDEDEDFDEDEDYDYDEDDDFEYDEE
jgi:hypothetical protein